MISQASVLPRRASVCCPAAAGFTLLEMIVVLAIIGLATLFIGFGRTPLSATTEARAAAEAISGALRSARSEALMTDRSVWFELDTATPSYRWGQRPSAQLSRDLRLGMLTSSGQQITKSVGRIRFDPDGGSTGGDVSIAGGNLIWQVGVDWISGRVSVVQKKP
jgi:general secretion pathway protein H